MTWMMKPRAKESGPCVKLLWCKWSLCNLTCSFPLPRLSSGGETDLTALGLLQGVSDELQLQKSRSSTSINAYSLRSPFFVPQGVYTSHLKRLTEARVPDCAGYYMPAHGGEKLDFLRTGLSRGL